MIVLTGEGITVYRAVVLKHGLRLYVKTGIRPNRLWTITNMLKTASKITGYEYKRGDAKQAINDLEAWIEVNGRMD
jgi:hypothetical protein